MPGKVLIVDDDSATRVVLSGYLEELECDYVMAESGPHCLAMLVTNPDDFSMILMDIHMPVLSGLDTASWIKDSEIDSLRDIPIFAVTADTSFLDADKLVSNKMRGVLRKPVNKNDLAQVLALDIA